MRLTVLGLDPGTVKMGYSILTLESNQIRCIDCSTLKSSAKNNMGGKLYSMNQQLIEVFKKYRPDHMAIEKVFFGKNPDSAFKLGQAFGIGLYQAYCWSCKVFEYTPRTVKKMVTGTGGASKESVQSFVCNILKLRIKDLDTSDAVALALCHIYQYQTNHLSIESSIN